MGTYCSSCWMDLSKMMVVSALFNITPAYFQKWSFVEIHNSILLYKIWKVKLHIFKVVMVLLLERRREQTCKSSPTSSISFASESHAAYSLWRIEAFAGDCWLKLPVSRLNLIVDIRKLPVDEVLNDRIRYLKSPLFWDGHWIAISITDWSIFPKNTEEFQKMPITFFRIFFMLSQSLKFKGTYL